MYRYDADTAINDDFIQDNFLDEDDRKDFKMALKHFRRYPTLGPLQINVIHFVVNYLFSPDKFYYYRRVFFQISEDGECTRDQLLDVFWRNGFADMSEIEADKVLSFVDTDGGGSIGFNEFVVTAISPEDLL